MEFEKTKLNEIKRGARKATYNKKEIYEILDATEICHISFIYDGKAFVQPINFGRCGDKIYLHGSYQNRMTTALIEAKEVCLSVMILDAMKLARSAYSHSVNFRSAMVFGKAKEVKDNDKKMQGLKSIINHFLPNRWEHCRKPNEKELNATRVVEISIQSASAKIADTPLNKNKEDLEHWAGIIPVKQTLEYPKPDEFSKDMEIPKHILDFLKKKGIKMPIIEIKMTKENGGASKEQKEKLQSGITKLFDEIFGRGGKSAVVILHEIDTDDYAIGGESITKIREKG